jgi:folate-dependent phosphoribosylglycinamide formyltransferase PurN
VKIALFTNSKPRHLSLIRQLARDVGDVLAVVEASTVRMGQIAEGYGASPGLAEYFDRVRDAEIRLFGRRRALPAGVRVLPMRMGDLSHAENAELEELLDADRFVVFGSSWIRGWLVDELVARGAINIHLGVAPFYRGSASNFWALWDRRPDLVGATIHELAPGLDNGDTLFHVVPHPDTSDPFLFTMHAVRAAHDAVARHLREGIGSAKSCQAIPQDRSKEIRYTRSREFTTEIAVEFMRRAWHPEAARQSCDRRVASDFVNLRIC